MTLTIEICTLIAAVYLRGNHPHGRYELGRTFKYRRSHKSQVVNAVK